MTTEQFVMVEELASLVKDNLSCKHLVLSVEEALINFLQNDTSPDGVLELEPMSPYHRMLLHRLADIYGFAHDSVGEGNDRHLILERCPESSIPAVLVSDILWQYGHDEFQSPPASHQLASLVKDNLSCKHLVLSVEEALINFLQNDTGPDGVLELEPMSPYHRMLLHRLADIYGFAHESVGEGIDRHLILERCPESSIPPVLVSDILWQYNHDEIQSPLTSHQLLKKDALPDVEMKQTSFPHSMSLEEREAAYLAARERIFSAGEDEVKLPVTPKQRNIPVVARRMIAHALGQRISSGSPDDKHTPPNNKEAGVVSNIGENKDQLSLGLRSAENSSSSQTSSSLGNKACSKRSSKGSVNHGLNSEKGMQSPAVCHGSSSSDVLQTGCDGRVGGKDNSEQEQKGAAKRIFAHALGLPSAKQNNGLALKYSEAAKQTTNNLMG